MSKERDKYKIGNVDLCHVRNRNEIRVVEAMRSILDSLNNPELSDEILLDAYALALNQLAARYVQRGSIVLRDPVSKQELEKAVAESMRHVLHNPKG